MSSVETTASGSGGAGQKPTTVQTASVMRMPFWTNVCRILLAVVFVFSGFVKAIDPLGTQYKMGEYLNALGLAGSVPQWMLLSAAVLLSAVEFCLGMFLLFAIHRRTVSKVSAVFMALMTLVTLWLWLANPVSDCGCFGDAVRLTNGQSLLKNLVLTGCAVVIARHPLQMVRFISKTNQWIVMNYSVLFIMACSLWCLYDLPMFDFRPYHVGADIRRGMEIPKGEKEPQYATTFILEKGGVRKEFTLDDYPDTTWTFVDSKTVVTDPGYVPPIHDFSIEERETGFDLTQDVLSNPGYVFLLVAPYLELASDANFGEIDQLSEYASEHGYPFLCLTASGDDAINRWRELTGAEYDFCMTDAVTLKTIVRSNPGLVLLKGGVVVRKWSHNRLPAISPEQRALPLEKMSIGELPEDSVPGKILKLLLWFVLPLFLLTLADRLWAWTQWLHMKKAKNNNPINI